MPKPYLLLFAGVALLAGCVNGPTGPDLERQPAAMSPPATPPPESPAPENPPPAVPVPAASPSVDQAASVPMEQTAPATYQINFDTTRGPVVVEINRAQAPHGADHLYSLVQAKFYDGARFYRVVPGFMVQWGAAADPKVAQAWSLTIPDDPVTVSNTRGTIAFAALSEPNSRSTHLFISFGDNSGLDAQGFAPLGKVVSGMDHVDRIYSGYGERPDQGQMKIEGNAYLTREFPDLDFIRTARIVP
jgi:peptidyl-prolyl cis-trans isomerase A (cyclophilin A)